MADESLTVLKDAFEAWRSHKRYAREAVPAELLERARAAARLHGSAAVSRATRVGRDRLVVAPSARAPMKGRSSGAASIVPAYSRMELSAPAMAPSTHPFAEVEMPSGLKVRLFNESGGALGLLSTLLGAGEAR